MWTVGFNQSYGFVRWRKKERIQRAEGVYWREVIMTLGLQVG